MRRHATCDCSSGCGLGRAAKIEQITDSFGSNGKAEREQAAMATLNMAFDIATNALEADQSALNIVSNNVANANTPGYTREVANWQENDPVTINGLNYGQGADVTGPVSQRDRVLEESLQQQGQLASASSARLTALDQVQSVFSQMTTANSSSPTDTANGISSDISSFFDSLAQLESSPSDNSLRQ